jgi:fatty acid desaturase
MGLVGSDPLSLTRTVINKSPLGRVRSTIMHNIEYHGVHHLMPTLKYGVLPQSADEIYARPDSPRKTLFSSYTLASLDMLKTLRDPKIGKAWVKPGC